jgi:NMD protein affecting ribosome stability and mRNA decay
MTMPTNISGQTAGPRRAGRAQDRDFADPYKRTGKLHEPTVCPQCGAVYHEGRWHWAESPAGAEEVICQACHRINDDYPAGIVTLSGGFVQQHHEEIVHLVRRQEEREKPEHPFNRIMAIKEDAGGMTVTTTDLHLAHRIGEAISGAYDGNLTMRYDEDGYFVRIAWHRER